jgi:hypothetical protein
MRLPRAAALAALAALASSLLLLAACGGSDDSGVAQAEGSGGTSTSATTTPASEADAEQAQLDFARCMREQGLDFPDPEPGENGGLRFRAPEGGMDDAEAFQDAAQECQEYLADVRPELSEEDQAELQDAQLEFAQCMRDEGVDVPDPQPGQGPGGGGLTQIDPDDPDVQAALDECRSIIQDARPAPGGER